MLPATFHSFYGVENGLSLSNTNTHPYGIHTSLSNIQKLDSVYAKQEIIDHTFRRLKSEMRTPPETLLLENRKL